MNQKCESIKFNIGSFKKFAHESLSDLLVINYHVIHRGQQRPGIFCTSAYSD